MNDFRSGFIAILGRPNVGKSTLVNALLGQKVAAVSPKPQTTRKRQLGILTTENAQLVFVDTPGIHTPRYKLGQFLNQEAQEALEGVDVILWLVDISTRPTDEEMQIVRISAAERPNLDQLTELLVSLSPIREPEFDEEQLTDSWERDIAADLIREACLLNLRDEVPHGVGVRVDEFAEREKGMLYIAATIFVERT